MTADAGRTETIIVEGVAGDAYYVTDGTIVVAVATRGGSRVELRMDTRSARRLAEQLREQVRLLEAQRADTEAAEPTSGEREVGSAPSARECSRRRRGPPPASGREQALLDQPHGRRIVHVEALG